MELCQCFNDIYSDEVAHFLWNMNPIEFSNQFWFWFCGQMSRQYKILKVRITLTGNCSNDSRTKQLTIFFFFFQLNNNFLFNLLHFLRGDWPHWRTHCSVFWDPLLRPMLPMKHFCLLDHDKHHIQLSSSQKVVLRSTKVYHLTYNSFELPPENQIGHN